LGAEGLDAAHGENILLAETPQEFVRALQDLRGETPLRAKLVEGARRLVASDYDWPLLGERLFEAHQEAVRRRKNR